jgi:hypothetical protein
MYYNLKKDNPCGYITKNKQRIKQFEQNVYLMDGSEFEIELYNPTKKTVLSKIKFNGEFISGSGIVLQPGERIFLERYLDKPNKFKFETYKVDSSDETMNAISENGDIQILFYSEEEFITYPLNTYNPYVNITYTTEITNPYQVTCNSNSYPDYKINYIDVVNRIGDGKNLIETGRIDKGSSSNQSFRKINKNFYSWVISTSTWKILPDSQKPFEKKDLIQRCLKCDSKIKKTSWKFCPECGVEIKEKTFEESLNELTKEELINLLKNK